MEKLKRIYIYEKDYKFIKVWGIKKKLDIDFNPPNKKENFPYSLSELLKKLKF